MEQQTGGRRYPASALQVLRGANAGETLAPDAGPPVVGDVYTLTRGAYATGCADRNNGKPTARLQFLDQFGSPVEGIVRHSRDGCWIAFSETLRTSGEYTLIAVSRSVAPVVSGAFARGTRISLATGALVAIETMSAGDYLLSRDHGPVRLRALRNTLLRAGSRDGPVQIPPGAINNAGPLAITPDQRLLLWRRPGGTAIGAYEEHVAARTLVNRDIRQILGGFVEYYQITMDFPCAVFAEGIAAEVPGSAAIPAHTAQDQFRAA